MQITTDELRKHYASLSDEELREIDPADLTEIARQCYEEEVTTRRVAPAGDDEEEIAVEPEVEPDWLETAACVCTFRDVPRASLARDALMASGVPCRLSEAEPDAEGREYQVMAPAGLHFKAKTVLDVQIFNAQEEEGVRAHLAGLSDKDLRALSLDDVCGGLRDLLERLTRAYHDEIGSR
jgi:hypothetical protein